MSTRNTNRKNFRRRYGSGDGGFGATATDHITRWAHFIHAAFSVAQKRSPIEDFIEPRRRFHQMPRQPKPNAYAQRPTGKHKLESLPPFARSYTQNGANQRMQVEKALGARDELRGPSPCPIEKIKDEYRWQIWYFVAGRRR